MTREGHAHILRMAVVDAMHTLRREAWECALYGCEESIGERTAMALVNDRLATLTDFAGLSDADAELEFDGGVDQPWQVTLPKGAER